MHGRVPWLLSDACTRSLQEHLLRAGPSLSTSGCLAPAPCSGSRENVWEELAALDKAAFVTTSPGATVSSALLPPSEAWRCTGVQSASKML